MTGMLRTVVAVWLVVIALCALGHVYLCVLASTHQGSFRWDGSKRHEYTKGGIEWSYRVATVWVPSEVKGLIGSNWLVCLLPGLGVRVSYVSNLPLDDADKLPLRMPDPRSYVVRDGRGRLILSPDWDAQLPGYSSTPSWIPPRLMQFSSGKVFDMDDPGQVVTEGPPGQETVIRFGPNAGWRQVQSFGIQSWVPLVAVLLLGSPLMCFQPARQAFSWWMGLPVRAVRGAWRRMIDPESRGGGGFAVVTRDAPDPGGER